MITANVFKKSLTSLFAAALLAIASTAAHAQILLQVVIDPITGIATISSTNNLLTISDQVGPYAIGNGVNLNNFFQADEGTNEYDPTSSSLTAATTTDSTLKFNLGAADTESDAGVFSQRAYALWNNGDAMLTFAPNQVAFSGSLTVNLSGVAINSGGDIIAGSSNVAGSPLVVIGKWEVVEAPEPSTWMLLVASIAFLPWLRRFCRS